MNVYISVDMEGITGVSTWSEVNRTKDDYRTFVQQMNREAAAAAQGALDAGAKRVIVRDAHEDMRNIDPVSLPEGVELIRGNEGNPVCMVQQVEECDALVMIGYHSAARGSSNPMSHTMWSKFQLMTVDGSPVSEFHLNSWYAMSAGVPPVFLSGDDAICAMVQRSIPEVLTLPVKWYDGGAMRTMHPETALARIRSGVKEALLKHPRTKQHPPKNFTARIVYKYAPDAYRASHYPGVLQQDPVTLEIFCPNIYELMRFIHFA